MALPRGSALMAWQPVLYAAIFTLLSCWFCTLLLLPFHRIILVCGCFMLRCFPRVTDDACAASPLAGRAIFSTGGGTHRHVTMDALIAKCLERNGWSASAETITGITVG